METLRALAYPSNLCLLLLAAAAAGCVLPASRRWARRLLAVTGSLLLVLASGWTAWALLAPLEYANAPASSRVDDPPATAIVVLGAYGQDEQGAPPSSWPNGAAWFRIVEAVHLRARCADCTIHVSGTAQTAPIMTAALISLGVPAGHVETDDVAEHTVDSARNLAARLRGSPFYLVTSAGHMPRALLAFRAQGLEPLPAPTDFQTLPELRRTSPLPSPLALYRSDIAVREHLGILWYRLQGL
jgi:uncharacterized SAM-binding protein YcdF (DUF218 family)